MNTASHGRLVRRSRAGRSAGPFFAFIVGVAGILGAVGCQKAPERPPDALTLYALDPYAEAPGKIPPAELFHGYRILGQSAIKEPERRGELVSELLASEQKLTRAGWPQCFSPRHGLRATRVGVIKDYVICFECYTVRVYSGDKGAAFLITDAAKPLFNRYLQEEGLPVPAEPKPTPRRERARPEPG